MNPYRRSLEEKKRKKAGKRIKRKAKGCLGMNLRSVLIITIVLLFAALASYCTFVLFELVLPFPSGVFSFFFVYFLLFPVICGIFRYIFLLMRGKKLPAAEIFCFYYSSLAFAGCARLNAAILILSANRALPALAVSTTAYYCEYLLAPHFSAKTVTVACVCAELASIYLLFALFCRILNMICVYSGTDTSVSSLIRADKRYKGNVRQNYQEFILSFWLWCILVLISKGILLFVFLLYFIFCLSFYKSKAEEAVLRKERRHRYKSNRPIQI